MPAPAALPPATTAITMRGISKEYAVGWRGAKLRALDQVNLTVRAGEIHALLGPNGSGKSTLLKVLLGLMSATAGTVELFGRCPAAIAARRAVGYVPEAPGYQDYLSGREVVRLHAGLAGMRGATLAAGVDRVLARVGLRDAADRRVGSYSKGMLQRLGLAQALVHGPRLVVLDEPTAGLDPIGAETFAALLLGLKREGTTILFTSHLLGEAEELSDRVTILRAGRVVLDAATASLTADGEGGGDRGGAMAPVATRSRLAEVYRQAVRHGA